MKRLSLSFLLLIFLQVSFASSNKQIIEKAHDFMHLGQPTRAVRTLLYAIQERPKKKLISSFGQIYNSAISEMDTKINQNLAELGAFLNVQQDIVLKEEMLSKVKETVSLTERGMELTFLASQLELVNYKKKMPTLRKPNYEEVRIAGLEEMENIKLDLAEVHYQKGKMLMVNAEGIKESFLLASREFKRAQRYIVDYKNTADLQNRCMKLSKQSIAVVNFQNSYSLEYAQYYVEEFKDEIKSRLTSLENIRLVNEYRMECDLVSEKRSNLDFDSQIIQSARLQDVDYVIVGEVSSGKLDELVLTSFEKNGIQKFLSKNTKSVDIDVEYRILDVNNNKTIDSESFHEKCSVRGVKKSLDDLFGLSFECKKSLAYSLSRSVENRVKKF